MQFDRKKFYAAYRHQFGALSQSEVDALEELLDAIEADDDLGRIIRKDETGAQKLGYALATFYHETAGTMRPIHEYGTTAYFNSRYGPKTAVGKRLGNIKEGDGARFAGRGFVQLTGRDNYIRAGHKLSVDLVGSPDLAMQPNIAFMIAFGGMSEGWFTGKSFAHYFKPGKRPDYVQARRIINGMDKAKEIAQIAETFEEILQESVLKDARPSPNRAIPSVIAQNGDDADGIFRLDSKIARVEDLTENVSSQISQATAQANDHLHKVEQSVTDKIEDSQCAIEAAARRAAEAAKSFNPETFELQIPKISKAKSLLMKLFGGAVFGAVSSYFAGLPMWFVFALFALAGIIVGALGTLLVIYHKEVFRIARRAMELRADPTQNNPHLTTENAVLTEVPMTRRIVS